MIKNVFRQMSPDEIEIEGIEDISMIHIYDLTGADKPDGKYGVTAAMVSFGENRQLNYTENDHCFDIFINKIFEVYNTGTDKDKVIMDETTRQIMEAGEVPRHDCLLSKFYEAEKREVPILVNASTLSKRFEPLIEYLLIGLYKTMGTEVDIIDRKCGWRGSGRLIIHVGDSNRSIYFKCFEMNDSEISIKLSGFLEETGDLLIYINLYEDSISISYKSEKSKIEGSSSFKFGKENLREMHQIQKNGEQIFYDVNVYENTFSKDARIEDVISQLSVGLLPEGMKPCAVYSLPMGFDFLLYDIAESSDKVEVQTFCGVFLWQGASYADVRGWSVIKSLESGLSLRNEAFRYINLSDNREFIQTAFLTGTGSRYKEKLEGKYVISERKSINYGNTVNT